MPEDNEKKQQQDYKLIVNKIPKEWPEQFITGAQIRTLGGVQITGL